MISTVCGSRSIKVSCPELGRHLRVGHTALMVHRKNNEGSGRSSSDGYNLLSCREPSSREHEAFYTHHVT